MRSINNQYLIWSYRHSAWWRPNRCGYTDFLGAAGLYSKKEASSIVKRGNTTEGALAEKMEPARDFIDQVVEGDWKNYFTIK